MGSIYIFPAIKRPFTNISKLFLGSILILIPVLNLLALGFLFNCIKERKALPNWNFNTFIDGLRVFILTIVYSIPLLIIFLLSYVLEISYSSLFILPLIIILILTIYIVPSAIVNFAKKGLFIQNTFSFAFSKDYLAAFLIGIVWFIILNSISVLLYSLLHWFFSLTLFFIISLLISAFLYFASQITFFTLLSDAYD